MQYVQIIDGNVAKGPKVLPSVFENIADFDKLPDDKLRLYGWLPAYNYNYNQAREIRGEPIIYIDRVEYPITPKPLEQVKSEQVDKFKPCAAAELCVTDWKTIRHVEQTELGIETSLTAQEYTDLITERQAIRQKSNDKEAEVMAATTVDEVFEVVWNPIEEP